MSFDWTHARAFLATADEGSFSAAARTLGVTQPTVGRQVAAFEEALGVTLFERVGRGLQLTPAGLDLAEPVRAMSEAAANVALMAAGQSMSLEGIVCIAASESIATFLLPPIVSRIRSGHPGIEIEIVASNQTSDLRRREADIAVRNFRPKDPALVARKVNESSARLYASPAYIDRIGTPTSPEDLSRADFFGFDRTDIMIEGLKPMGLNLSASNFPIVTSSHLVQWELAKEGLGICIIMEEIGDPEPRLCRVLPDLPPFVVPVWITCHSELRINRRMRVVFDLLVEGLQG